MDKPPWKQVISPVPQIEQFKIDPSWEFLIIATDGVNTIVIYFQITIFKIFFTQVWDAVTNNEALNFVKSKIENRYK